MAKSVNKSAGPETRPTEAKSLLRNGKSPLDSTPGLSRWLVIVGWIGMLVFAGHACTRMVAAGDTWWAMACGRHFINHGVDTVEPFSANSHKAGPTPEEIKTWPSWAQSIANTVGLDTVRYWHPTGWVNQNWLTHVIFSWLSTTLGSEEEPFFNALIYWKFTLYILAVVCVYAIGRVMGVHPTLSAASACFALFVGRSFLDVRPAGFSNLLVAVFVLILVLTTYRNVLYIWFIVPVTVFWCNVHGGYLYVFIMLVPFWGLNLLTLPFKRHCQSIGVKGLYHTVGAGVAAFIAMVIFNPFHLTNLTHTFIISLSKNAARWRQVHEWHRAFDWTNPVGTAIPFLIMYILAWVALIAWFVVQRASSQAVYAGNPKLRNRQGPGTYQWPQLRLPLLAVAALTIYMAIRSRRFIPIAAFAACPFLALLIHEIVQSLAAARQFSQTRQLMVPPMSKDVKRVILLLAGGIVITFGSWAGLKYRRIYLNPWPADPDYSSVFMRMTASFMKPFAACEFIRLNNLSGKMMNYWTEGGFIAWGQKPDPETGKTPLQLFMDGRAQAAYDREAFDTWHYIWAGGAVGREVQMRRQQAEAQGRKAPRITTEDYKKMGQWVDKALKNRDVWIALVPAGQFSSNFCRALEHCPTWQAVFINNKQKLFVDWSTEQGKKLFDGVLTGETKYPDEFTRHLNLARFYLAYVNTDGAKKTGLDHAIKAMEKNPSPIPMLEIVGVAARYAGLSGEIKLFCEELFKDFEAKRTEYARQDGYRARLEAARLACAYLQNIALAQKDNGAANMYTNRVGDYAAERDWQTTTMKW
jgi:hypothetical protein